MLKPSLKTIKRYDSHHISQKEQKILYALPLFVSINFIIHSNCLTDKNETPSKHASEPMREM